MDWDAEGLLDGRQDERLLTSAPRFTARELAARAGVDLDWGNWYGAPVNLASLEGRSHPVRAYRVRREGEDGGS